MPTIVRVNSPHLWSIAARLVREYAASLNVGLEFQDFDDELSHLPTVYGPPGGIFLLAQRDGEFVGCGAIRRFSESACEMKRLYVVPGAQNRGVGRLLATTLLDEAGKLGYKSVLLDTLPSMQRAQALYRSLGFEEVASYRFNPVPGSTFMKLEL